MDLDIMRLQTKLATAKKVFNGGGVSAVVRRGLVVAADTGVDLLYSCAARLRRKSHLLSGRNSLHLLNRNRQFENLHAGQRAFVLATGPSIADQNLSPLANELTFAVNNFWRHPVMTEWQPTYYCIVDRGFFRTDGRPGGSTDDLKNAAKYSVTSKFLVPWYGEESCLAGDLPIDQTYFLSFAGWAQEGNITWPNLHKPIIMTWNVVQTALLTAMAMGCNPIYMLGCDHDWGAKAGDWKHFHPNDPQYDAKEFGGFSSATHMYRDAYFIMKSYQEIRSLCEARGVKIYNATRGGRLDVFERVALDTLFEKDAAENLGGFSQPVSTACGGK